MEVLGHELAHSIDPCNQQFPVIRVNQAKTSRLPKSDSEHLHNRAIQDLFLAGGSTAQLCGQRVTS